MRNFANARWKQWRSENELWGSGNGLRLANGPPARKSHCRTFYKVKGEAWSFSTFSRDAGRKNIVLAAWEASLKRGGSCGVREPVVASLPSSASRRSPPYAQRSPPSARKGTVLKHITVQLVNGLGPSNKWPVRQRGVYMCVYVCARTRRPM